MLKCSKKYSKWFSLSLISFFFAYFFVYRWVHLMFNLLVQLLVGLPLEMVHGSLRIGCVYMAGVLAGSLGTSVFDPDVYLVGASGGVYALLAAHLANVLLNYNNMEFGLVRLLGVFLIGKIYKLIHFSYKLCLDNFLTISINR